MLNFGLGELPPKCTEFFTKPYFKNKKKELNKVQKKDCYSLSRENFLSVSKIYVLATKHSLFDKLISNYKYLLKLVIIKEINAKTISNFDLLNFLMTYKYST